MKKRSRGSRSMYVSTITYLIAVQCSGVGVPLGVLNLNLYLNSVNSEELIYNHQKYVCKYYYSPIYERAAGLVGGYNRVGQSIHVSTSVTFG